MIEVIERLRAGSGPDRELDAEIARTISGGATDHWFDHLDVWSTNDTIPPYTASIDAALALVERVMPEYCVLLNIYESGSATCSLGIRREIWGATPALAILTAIFTALEAKDTTHANDK